MNPIIIKTQAEYDALPKVLNEYTVIELRSSNTFWLQIKTVPFNSTVKAHENSMVSAHGNSVVVAFNKSTVRAYDNSMVEAYDNSMVYACDNSTVEACDNSTVEAFHNSTVEAFNNSKLIDYRKKPKEKSEPKKEKDLPLTTITMEEAIKRFNGRKLKVR
jgi:hypothetical protein